MVEKIFCLTYNILNKEADTIVHTYPFPAKYCTENSTFTLPERGCYFLCVKFRMATISKAVLTIRLNSSYVLIKTASFLQGSETEVFTPYRLPGQVYNMGNAKDICGKNEECKREIACCFSIYSYNKSVRRKKRCS